MVSAGPVSPMSVRIYIHAFSSEKKLSDRIDLAAAATDSVTGGRLCAFDAGRFHRGYVRTDRELVTANHRFGNRICFVKPGCKSCLLEAFRLRPRHISEPMTAAIGNLLTGMKLTEEFGCASSAARPFARRMEGTSQRAPARAYLAGRVGRHEPILPKQN